ncbi:MAG: AAA family ATPase [Rhizobacter sp.]
MPAIPHIFIIAGPNGAGKTTFAREFLPQEAACPVFVNADLIAAGLSPFRPEAAALEAGRLMLSQIRMHVSRRESFAFETTLAGRSYAQHIPRWQAAGYFVDLIFLALDNPQMAAERVAQRVLQGGHSIEPTTISRRFEAGLRNFSEIYQPIVNRWAVYDNSGATPVLLTQGENP